MNQWRSNLLLGIEEKLFRCFTSSRRIHYCEISCPWDLRRRENCGNCNLDNLRLVSPSHGRIKKISWYFWNEKMSNVHLSVISREGKRKDADVSSILSAFTCFLLALLRSMKQKIFMAMVGKRAEKKILRKEMHLKLHY